MYGWFRCTFRCSPGDFCQFWERIVASCASKCCVKSANFGVRWEVSWHSFRNQRLADCIDNGKFRAKAFLNVRMLKAFISNVSGDGERLCVCLVTLDVVSLFTYGPHYGSSMIFLCTAFPDRCSGNCQLACFHIVFGEKLERFCLKWKVC